METIEKVRTEIKTIFIKCENCGCHNKLPFNVKNGIKIESKLNIKCSSKEYVFYNDANIPIVFKMINWNNGFICRCSHVTVINGGDLY